MDLGGKSRNGRGRAAFAQRRVGVRGVVVVAGFGQAAEPELAEFETEGLVGTPEQITEQLARTRDLGLGYAICYFPDAAYDRSGIDLFAAKVIPELAS